MEFNHLLLILVPAIFAMGFILNLLGAFSNPHKLLNKNAPLLLALTGCIAIISQSVLILAQQEQTIFHGALGPIFNLPINKIENTATATISIFFTYRIDKLSAFFLLVTGIVASAVVIYSFSWLEDKQGDRRIAGTLNLFLLFTWFVLIVNDGFFFIIALECLSLIFGYLTLYKHNLLVAKGEPSNAEEIKQAKLAFKSYMIFNHIGIMLVLIGVLILSCRGDYSLNFDSYRISHNTSTQFNAFVFGLVFIGFGIKSALYPFHSWMALTHPYLPTNIHSMVSSVIIKVAGIYGLLRFIYEFLPREPWEGPIILIIAACTALVGVFNALISHDLKTALANHSVENIGIILAGIGLNLSLGGNKFPGAYLALLASLYHLMNHSIFKSLLFMCTGAIEKLTGTVALEKLGGLIHSHRGVAILFIVGSVAISGFPPFNGFISEWLLLQAFLSGLSNGQPSTWVLISMVIALTMLSLSFGLTALAFSKICGEVLLGRPRENQQSKNQRTSAQMWVPMSVFALICLLLGLFPGTVVKQLSFITERIIRVVGKSTTVNIVPALVDNIVLPILLMLLFSVALIFILYRYLKKGLMKVDNPSWNCGIAYQPATMRITGSAYGSLLWERFSKKLTQSEITNEQTDSQDVIPWQIFMSTARFVIEGSRYRINKVAKTVIRASNQFGSKFQNGDIRSYVIYLYVLFLAILIAIPLVMSLILKE